MRTAKSMETETGFGLLRLAIVGKEKAGKSRLAATAPKPVLFFDTDQRRESIAGIPGVYAITYSDPALPMQPTGFSEILDDVTRLEKEGSLLDFGFAESFSKGETHPATIVVDSTASLSRLIMAFNLYSSPKLRREVNIGGKMNVFFPGGFDAWNAEMSTMESFILRLLALPTNVIVTFHEAAEEAPDSTQENPKFTGRISPFPVRHGRLLRYFNEVWRLERNGQVPTVQLVPDYRFTTATNLLLDKVEKPDISFLISQHNAKLAERGKAAPAQRPALPALAGVSSK